VKKLNLEYIKEWLEFNKSEFKLCDNNIYLRSEKKLKFFHDVEECFEYFEMSWNHIQSGQGCPVCRGLQVGEKTSLAYLRHDLVIEWHPDNDISPTKVPRSSHRKIYWICSNCDYGRNKEWCTSPNSRTNMNSGCPKCASSKGEKKIKLFLDSLCLYYLVEYKFSDCRNILELPFDFYLLDYNLCIEYDSILHYEDKFNEPEEFKLVQKRDKIKTKYCKNNNINLLRIPYWEFDNIEQILSNALL